MPETIAENTNADPLLTRSDENAIATLTLNNPKTLNALSKEMLHALSAQLDEIAADRSVKVVIIRSSGKHFCAGHNLKEMTAHRNDDDGGFQYFVDLFKTCSDMMLRIVRLPQPVIAEVTGIAITQHARTARIGAEVAANAGRPFGCKRQGEQPASLLGGGLHVGQDHACLCNQDVLFGIDRADCGHLFQ